MPPPACACRLDAHIHGGEKVWTWAAAAASCPSPPCGWARPAPSPATSISAWMWPTKTLPSTVSPATTVRWGDVLHDQQLRTEMGGGYDMVLANIVADVIMGLSGSVRDFLKPGGLFLCSGIIDDRAEEVLQKAEVRRLGRDRAAQQRGLVQLPEPNIKKNRLRRFFFALFISVSPVRPSAGRCPSRTASWPSTSTSVMPSAVCLGS